MKKKNLMVPSGFNPSFVLHKYKNKCCWEYQAVPGKGSDENQQSCTDAHKHKMEQTHRKHILKL